MNANALFLIHAVATFFLVGLIWTVQIVHYPLMGQIGEREFTGYENEHGRVITPLVAPMMVLELLTGILLVTGAGPAWLSQPSAWAGLAAISLIWGSTFFIQVPCHNLLLNGFDSETHRWLVLSNWIRTILWTARGLGLSFLLWRGLQGATVSPLES